jgi:hypothetical protein
MKASNKTKPAAKTRQKRKEAQWLADERERIMAPWRQAIGELREHLAGQCSISKADDRHFQDGKLASAFAKAVESAPESKLVTLLDCYWLFVGSPWEGQLGYNEARRQHLAEIKACGLGEKFDWTETDDPARKANELLFRLTSLASWIEAHESLSMWQALNESRATWLAANDFERARAMAAHLLAKFPALLFELSSAGISLLWRGGEWKGKKASGLIHDCDIKNGKQWAQVLRKAADLAEEPPPLTDLQKWVWWKYPIFRRYKWSASEAREAAREKFKDWVRDFPDFRREWIGRGLRFDGRRTNRNHPPLWDFVLSEQVPGKVDLACPIWL